MIVGLLRHFPVDFSFSKWCDSQTFNRDMNTYNRSPVRNLDYRSIEQKWDICFTSPMKRAVDTAKILFNREYIPTSLLREVPLVAGFQTRMKIPLFLWAIIGRGQWLLNSRRQPENRNQSHGRARSVLSQIIESADTYQKILLVTHGFFMLILRRELLGLGFRGPRLLHVKNGKLYQYEKTAAPGRPGPETGEIDTGENTDG